MATSETNIQLESRLAILEAKVTQLQQKLETVSADTKPWWEYVVGAFADDPHFEEAMRLGREYRESLRPESRARRSKPSAKARKR